MKRSHYVAWVFYMAFLALFFYYTVTDGVAGDYKSPMGSQNNYESFYDEDKAEFFRATWGTFQSANPRTESFDSEYTGPSNVEFHTELKRHYAHFDGQLNSIARNGCPVKQVDVPSRYQNLDAEHRSFLIFEIENCKSQKGE